MSSVRAVRPLSSQRRGNSRKYSLRPIRGIVMPIRELKQRAEHLENRISRSDYLERLRLQPEFSRVIDRLRAEGVRVPTHLSNLEYSLAEEAIEAQFDNMPV